MVLKHICEYQTVAFGAITSFQSFDHLTPSFTVAAENAFKKPANCVANDGSLAVC